MVPTLSRIHSSRATIPGDIIMWYLRWYLRLISFTHMAEMAIEGGLAIDASCISYGRKTRSF